MVASPVASFRAKIEHGCLILQDVSSENDVADWDPATSNWYREGSSIIFGVRPGVDGPVECEVWTSSPPAVLPVKLFEDELPCPSGWLVIHDPNEHVRMQFRGIRGSMHSSVMVDDAQFPSRVQVILEAPAALST